MPSPISLLQLLGTPTVKEFFDRVWEREARLARGAIKGVSGEILTVDVFEVLMASAVAGASTGCSVVEGRVARPVLSGGTGMPTVYDAYHRQCTLLQSGLQLRWQPIARLCRDIENELIGCGFPLAESVGANAYLTPAHSQGFDIHYDNHCALILQLQGRKNWAVFPPIDELPVARCERGIRRDELRPPVLSAELTVGDVLYVPRGFPHCASTGDESSLHLTLSMRPMTWVEAIQGLCESDPIFRHSVTPVARGSSLKETLFNRELLPRLANMDVDAFLRLRVVESLTKLAPLPLAGLRAIEASRELGPDTPVVRAPQVMCLVTEESSEAVLRFSGSSLRLCAEMKPVFEFVITHEEFTPAMLPSIESVYDRVKLVQILIRRGLLRPKERGQSATPMEAIAGEKVL